MTSGLNLAWLDNYSDFVSELRKNFRLHDPEGNLETLRMCDNQCIVKYLINFNRLAAHVQWGKAALCRQLYHGLPSQIKDKIACVGKPDTLSELRTFTQSINSRYWECRCEVCLRYFTKSLHATVFMQTVYSTVVRGNSNWVCDKG